jgi:outer membrane murein-binding lipoprotein Lpp
MRRLLALITAAVVVMLVAGCGNNASSDPYQLVLQTRDAKQDQVQIDFGASVKSSGATIALDPGAIRVVIDSAAGKGTFHLSLPAAALGVTAAQLAQIGITGTTIDADVLWDGQALYAKSPILGTLITAFGAQGGITVPSGDLTGWLKLLTKADLDTLGLGAAAAATAAPTAPDAATLKTELNNAGITLTLAGTETKNGVTASHITMAIDVTKFLDSPMVPGSVQKAQLDQLREAAKTATVAGDLWVDNASKHLVEADVHIVSTGAQAGSVDLSIAFSTPSAPNFDAPASAIEIPTMQLVGQLIQMFGASLGG